MSDPSTFQQLRSQICPGRATCTTMAAVATVATAAGACRSYQEAQSLIARHPLLVGEAVDMNQLLSKSSALSLYDWLTQVHKDGHYVD